MKHSGKARKAAFKMILVTLILLVALFAAGLLALMIGSAILVGWWFLAAIWAVFAIFVLYFFRDPTPRVPMGKNLVISPAHGKVDIVDTTTETRFMGGECQRISIFLSVLDVHVQNAPVSGKVAHFKYTEGQFMNAMKTECAACNENVLIGFECSEPAETKVGIRLIAGVLARRIVPWIEIGDDVARGERISLIQFGSRCDVYLPRSAQIKIKIGDRVVGGETILATLD
jgi:phosphatidylserine decarboxylase